MAKCANCHGDLGEGGTARGVDPRKYTEAELTQITPAVNSAHATACNTAENCAANTAAYLISLSPKVAKGETLYRTLGASVGQATGSCIDCHGEEGLGDVAICGRPNEFCTDVRAYAQIKASVEIMGRAGRNKTPYLCTATAGGANCSEDVALYLKALGWTRKTQ
jgi:mono/diheme cytochrome c family protein